MTASTWDPAYGWGTYGAFSIQSGQTVRMGLTWAGDPGPVFLTTTGGTLPSTVIREHPTREFKHDPSDGYAYETTEWITVTATGPDRWVEEVGLSYLGTYQADDRRTIAIHDDVIPISLRYHVIAVDGRVLAWVRMPPAPQPPQPPAPMPVIAPGAGWACLAHRRRDRWR